MSGGQQGCRACGSMVGYLGQGAFFCGKRPYKGSTAEQRAIVAWFNEPNREAWYDTGCPSFELYKVKD